ncbi:shikimate dehydrogenase family protein [Solitalea canadensis]|uniref:Shikimate 5-dehydrogenase n=1 Tax=Solitalea canadensis (strain ATCC 29591 / DSM 3403 / JCM 21819 / LMG 8368 / NBRC 15130 / NCIMB 12057 / USAM 9D) TaxID=929556 RepID=H8KLT4_SOLCM|nr:shikimate dehydrogenase [Solitalea canadensis]AFD09238.1 shikimate 5-dehydrogenase [Solitalea canadensis DSM 3403]
MKKFGLIGFPLSHSFSQKYFTQKFEQLGLADHQYNLYPIEEAKMLLDIINNDHDLVGINVTIPHKIAVMPLLDTLDDVAKGVGAVNVIKITRNEFGKVVLTGSNSDVVGFRESLRPLLKPSHKKALILGTGGASKAVEYALNELGITYKFVSRTAAQNNYTYEQLSGELMKEYSVIINCSPLGTYPNIDACPTIPYEFLTSNHLLYDLVYNPEETLFMKKGKEKGAIVKNGLEMLHLQAERSWEIWNK